MTDKTNDYLVSQLEERDGMIEELRDRIETLEEEARRAKEKSEYEDAWSWRHIETLEASERYPDEGPAESENYGLPVPRMELRWAENPYFNSTRTATYGIVVRHFLGQIIFIPFGSTKQSGGMAYQEWQTDEQRKVSILRTPFRDGAHLTHDAKSLGLPAFVVAPDHDLYREVDLSGDRDEFGIEDVKEIQTSDGGS